MSHSKADTTNANTNLTTHLTESDLSADPFKLFEQWLQQAVQANLQEPNAMTLATATADGKPSARMVLMRGFDQRGFVFYTNYDSRKGVELADNPQAALVFHWPPLQRQVRIEGHVERVSQAESEAYFHSRPAGSQLSAWSSQQSQAIESRAQLEAQLQAVTERFVGQTIPLPPFWGGFRVVPHAFEFWQSGPFRLHDRFRYTRRAAGNWLIERLSP